MRRRRRAILGIVATASALGVFVIIFLLIDSGKGSPSIASGASHPIIALSTRLDVRRRLQGAHVVEVAAFVINEHSSIVRELETAADRGATVSVHLSRGFGLYISENAATTEELAAHAIHVDFASGTNRSFHMKAMIIDGELFLSDRNWSDDRDESIVVEDSSQDDARIVRQAIDGDEVSNDHLWTRKMEALQAEVSMLELARATVVRISSESFGGPTSLFEEMEREARAGVHVELLVAESEYAKRASERASVNELESVGVDARLSRADEKYAIAGDGVWIGSANATTGLPDQVDFGLVLRDRFVADTLAKRFDAEWLRGRDVF